MNIRFTLFLLVVLLSACAQSNYRAYYNTPHHKEVIDTIATHSDLVHRFYFVGDAGAEPGLSVSTMELLRTSLQQESADKASVYFLGDNLYSEGLHKKEHPERLSDEAKLLAQINAVKDFEGKVVFIPGNHDWKKGHEGGWEQLLRQEKFIKKHLGKGSFLPKKGCPGPELVEINDNLAVLVLDSQWWMHRWDKPSGEKDGCEAANELEFMEEVKDILKKYRNKNLIVAAHHPVFSNGEHGGHFTLKDHIFPLTVLNDALYVPLPIIGSHYPTTRKFLGHPQDLAHPTYTAYANFIKAAFDNYENLVYIAGHEHNIQYRNEKNNHFIISGSGSKSTHLARNKDIDFGTEAKGLVRISYYENGECWMEVLQASPKVENNVIYRKQLYTQQLQSEVLLPKSLEWPDTVVVIPDHRYEASKTKRVFFGDLYRDLWVKPLKVPVFDMETAAGGVRPVRLGGDMQTRSLRLVNDKGQQYVLRTIDKSATYLVSSDLRNTIAQDVLHDGISGSHPYAAVVVPPMAEALNIYYANPQLVYVPDDPNLGEFQELFGGRFCLYEEKPKGDMSHVASMGNAPKVFSSSKAFDKVQSKYKHKFDKEYIVKARLLDMILGDWDRHDGQWKWRTIKTDDFTYYRPIPVDRDQVFFTFDGVIPLITNRKWLFRKFQTYGPNIRDIIGQNYNARYFDRTVLIEANRDDWVAAAKMIQKELTDKVIDEALALLPPEAIEYNAEFLRESLISRRNQIVDFANEYYEVLAEEVEISGTTKDDYFEIKHLSKDEVSVAIYRQKDNKKKGKPYYQRIFNRKVTKEIRVFGIGGEDIYNVTGDAKKSIKIRLIGGRDEDTYIDNSKIKSWGHQTVIYDQKKGDDVYELSTSESRRILRPTRDLIQYDRKAFKYNVLMPLINMGSNPNDKFFLGGGFKYTKYGFNKSDYKTMHKLVANVSPFTGTFNIYYDFDFPERIGPWGIGGKLEYNGPLNFDYYGQGNESITPPEGQEDLYGVSLNRILFMPHFHRKVFNGMVKIKVGLSALSYEFADHIIENPIVPEDTRVEDTFAGVFFEGSIGNVDNKVAPTKGVKSVLQIGINESINEHLPNRDIQDDYHYIRLKSNMYNRLSFLPFHVVYGMQIGYQLNAKDHPFYLSNFLDGTSNFRGVWRNRYAGRSLLHVNNDLRIKLLHVQNHIIPFDIGMITHYDIGRVWLKNDKSKHWHQSYGVGIYFNVIDAFVLTATSSYTDKGQNAFLFGTSFFF